MQFLIADTFTDSLAKLTNEEQKAVKTTVFDLQVDPANNGIKLHRIARVKDKGFWSARVSRDIRLIIHKSAQSMLVCYVDHHDQAYDWASRRKLERHPTTGAAQMVLIRERVQEVLIPTYVQKPEPKQRPLAAVPEGKLLQYGIPQEWVKEAKQADEDELLALAALLPAEAAEALLNLAVGHEPPLPLQADPASDPFEHPDAKRRFRVMDNLEELQLALEYPWEKWSVFLHPAQREIVQQAGGGPARVSGTAGTGKTIVALHRAVWLAEQHPEARVLLTTFSDVLASALDVKLRRLISTRPRLKERIETHALPELGLRLYKSRFGEAALADDATIAKLLQEAVEGEEAATFSARFLMEEWKEVVDAWQLQSWDEYRVVQRIGRKTRLPENRRKLLWAVFEKLREKLAANNLTSLNAVYRRLEAQYRSEGRFPYDFVVVDESQDISVAQLRLLSLLGDKPGGLFFAGDLGQRIFQQPFSWKSLGVDIRGRSRTLHINYRTSHQIRRQADLLLDPVVRDVDGNEEVRNKTVSVFNSPTPDIHVFETEEAEQQAVTAWLADKLESGVQPSEIGLFTRTEHELDRAKQALEAAGYPYTLMTGRVQESRGITLSTMHLAKGLEFRAVVVMACDDEVIPLQSRIEQIADQADLEEIYNTERHLLYVACTRARDYLLVTGTSPESEFLDDLRGK
ncbi:UvrD/REP helicase N-terminal domain-containing protein [Cyclonatronum proteinivorum]|uniref:DNA 3'-5' helicase n=1 Tax=Cyclonatronum proteinivorum TaxID=1457365 RepID=A0A345UHM0_9BACT|nr:3'-5' exonuclease [Cyclonatronum proteinivorum]AXI99971.1 UvrD/REP helicase N-terminal domain-containing protein [Cyclonatronum proteinivorum]